MWGNFVVSILRICYEACYITLNFDINWGYPLQFTRDSITTPVVVVGDDYEHDSDPYSYFTGYQLPYQKGDFHVIGLA